MADLVMYGAMLFAVYIVFVLVRWLLTRNKRSAQHATQRQAATVAESEEPESALTLQQMLDVDKDTQESGLVARR